MFKITRKSTFRTKDLSIPADRPREMYACKGEHTISTMIFLGVFVFKEKNSELKIADVTELLSFFSSYSRLIELQLAEVRVLISETVEQVMQDVKRISSASELRKKDANSALLETFVSPDEDTKKLVVAIQDSVTDVFDQAIAEHRPSESHGVEKKSAKPPTAPQVEGVLATDSDARLRRAGGRFTKHLEAIDKLDSELSDILFSMISALSADDVIGQRMEHIALSISLLKQAQKDAVDSIQKSQMQQLQEKVLSATLSCYTTEHEKQVFKKVFTDAKLKVKKIA